LLLPNLTIDGVILTLLVVAIFPWLTPLIKSVELPGGFKLEFQELQRAANEAEKVGLLGSTAHVPAKPKYSFQLVSEADPNLSLAGLRIEIEKKMLELAQSYDFQGRKASISQLLRFLSDKNVLTQQQRAVLSDIITLLNSAAHGARVDQNAAAWALEVGPKFLEGLDERFPHAEPWPGA
jgi:hypothetical protein